MIPLVKVGFPEKEVLMPALETTLYSGMIGEGEYVYEFEKAFAQKFLLGDGLAFSSGTAALHAALVLAGVGPGDEVITTSMTAEPTNTTILQIGATPVFADVDVLSGNLEPTSVESKIGPHTKAILVVHYAGFPARLDELHELAVTHDIKLIEDCAHALGSNYRGKSIGTIGDFAIFSFQAIKHMTTVDGGFLIFKDKNLTRTAKKFRWFGLEKGVPRTEVDITSQGYKYNMNNVTATIGLKQLECIDGRINKHKDNGKYYDEQIVAIPGLSVTAYEEHADPSYWLYTVLSDDSDDVERRLGDIGVTASKLHRPNHFHSMFKPYAGELPNLTSYYARMTHIPCGWWVTADVRAKIVDALRTG
ncbi:DegT/DnrJ/EryC1/StrS family aminotransferase [Allopusillimonas ginsengisoli]|uniref:DegT/DnrJ/EryC1/StrS family aminotransferase n=1 Tax=Allopusillimonas ginsengisoli TaxID=453575 RepID=UPI0039C4C7F4